MTTITINHINKFLKYAQLYAKADTKLAYGIRKVLKLLQEDALQKHAEDVEDLRIEYCSTDERGNVVYDEKGNLLFTKENLRELNKKLKELMHKPYAFAPHFISDVPPLTEEEREAFEGIVIQKAEVKEQRAERLFTEN